MNTFAQAVKNDVRVGVTDNGALTLTSSTDACVDLFFLVGASRACPGQLAAPFTKAYVENPGVTLRIAQWARDVRGGAGEREVGRQMLHFMLSQGTMEAEADANFLITKWPMIGRWDDVLVGLALPETHATTLRLIWAGLAAEDGLLGKWLPRQGLTAIQLRNALGMTPKHYRKTLVRLSDTVEQKMCANQWPEIDYSKVPSIASARYQKAFGRHDTARYGDYIKALQKGETKINAGAIYPYQVLTSLTNGNEKVAIEQWKALPNYLGASVRILPMCDVSGSMATSIGGNTTALEVCISLGLYIADKQKGVFAGMFCEFSTSASIRVLRGNLKQKVMEMSSADWGMSTNLQAAFEQVLRIGVVNGVPDAEMPTHILIFSDMEFDSACGRHTNFEVIQAKYAVAGYTLPKVVFWNLVGRPGNVPVRAADKNVALVSGFSPGILTAILEDPESITPTSVMLGAVMVDRYA